MEVVGCPLSCPVSIYGSSGQPNLHGKIPMDSPLRCPLSCPLFLYLEVVDFLLSCPLFPYMEVVGSLICMAKFPWAAHGQPTPLPTCSPWAAKWAAPLFFPYGFWQIFRFQLRRNKLPFADRVANIPSYIHLAFWFLHSTPYFWLVKR